VGKRRSLHDRASPRSRGLIPPIPFSRGEGGAYRPLCIEEEAARAACAGEDPEVTTRAEIEAALAEYLAGGGAIARLPDESRPDVREVRLNEEIERLMPVPWDEVMGDEVMRDEVMGEEEGWE